nr:PPOX class F420-dependent oxidoreductase [Kineosphaera limosa]
MARVRGASGGPAAAEPPAAEPAAAEPVGTPSGNLSVLERLGAAEFVALTTFRRSGEPVTTPMWVARDGDELVFTTPTDSGKIKRLRRDPRVRVQVCSRLGKIQPGALAADGQATLAAGAAEVARGSAVLRRKYGWQYAVMLRAERLFKREQLDRTILRVRLG